VKTGLKWFGAGVATSLIVATSGWLASASRSDFSERLLKAMKLEKGNQLTTISTFSVNHLQKSTPANVFSFSILHPIHGLQKKT